MRPLQVADAQVRGACPEARRRRDPGASPAQSLRPCAAARPAALTSSHAALRALACAPADAASRPVFASYAGFLLAQTIAKLDATANDWSKKDVYDVKGFPTIYFKAAGAKAPVAYEGERETEAMAEWLAAHATHKFEVPGGGAKKGKKARLRAGRPVRAGHGVVLPFVAAACGAMRVLCDSRVPVCSCFRSVAEVQEGRRQGGAVSSSLVGFAAQQAETSSLLSCFAGCAGAASSAPGGRAGYRDAQQQYTLKVEYADEEAAVIPYNLRSRSGGTARAGPGRCH